MNWLSKLFFGLKFVFDNAKLFATVNMDEHSRRIILERYRKKWRGE